MRTGGYGASSIVKPWETKGDSKVIVPIVVTGLVTSAVTRVLEVIHMNGAKCHDGLLEGIGHESYEV
jgi:hypothetical protein